MTVGATSTPGDAGFLVSELPPVAAAADLYRSLAVPPRWNEAERALPPSARRACVMRLGSYFMPGSRHLKLAEGFLMFLRAGYEGRGRAIEDHMRRVRRFADEHAAGTLMDDAGDGRSDLAPRVTMTSKAIGTRNTARSALLIGTAGMGKSLTTEEILNGVPELIEHRSPVTLKQVVWIKLDCPHKGSVKALCLDFFTEMDRILGDTNYVRMYASARATEESMMSHMALIANLHALGVLVIDEIQHLGRAREDNDVLLKFLVTMINKIGVPVMLIGTNAASEIVRRTMRLGRRSVGVGSQVWERYSADDPDWRSFLDDLWGYQWTSVRTELDDDLRDEVYDLTQGVVDLAVKLFMMAQMRAIRIGEARGGEERITRALLRRVSEDELAIVRPMVAALRAGDRRGIEKYGDLSPLRDRFTKILQGETGRPDLSLPAPGPGHRGTRAGDARDAEISDDDRFFIEVFRQLGIADDVGVQLLADVRRDEPDADPFRLLELLRERLARPTPKKKSRKSASCAAPVPLPANDLRAIVAAGAAGGISGYRALAAAGQSGQAALLRTA